MCIVITNVSMLSAVTALAEQSDSLVQCDYITSEKTGNIFANTDDISFTQTVKNTASETVFSKYSWNITDETGTLVKSYSWTETFSANETKNRSISIENPKKFGIYTINVREENYASSKPNRKYTDTYSEEFSVCISLNASNIDPDFGFNQVMVNGGDYKSAVPLMKGAGAKWHRESVMWQGVEPKVKGTYIDLGPYKEKLRQINESNMESLCVLTGRNPLYDSGNNPSSDEAIEAFADFCAHIAQEFKGIVNYYEIWNEWNAKNFNPTLVPASTYAKVLRAAYKAIKAVDPNIVVIGCDSAGIVPSWIQSVLVSPALNDGTGNIYMDAISVHCYDYSATDAFPEEQFIDEVKSLKALLDTYKIDIPIWLSEIGFSTYDNSNPGFVPGCTRETQLNSMVMLHAINKAYGLVDKLIQYCLCDNADKSYIEANWGVVNCWQRDYTTKPEAKLLPNGAKPSYLGVAAMNYFIGGNCDYVNMTKDDRSYEFEFYNHNLDKKVILAINGGFNNIQTKEFKLGCTSIDIYDKYGNLTKHMESPTGEYTVDTYSDPIYITGNFKESDVYYPDIKLSASIDLNTQKVTITGKTYEPNDPVSVMVVTQGEELSAYDPARVKYLAQTVSDAEGNFKIVYSADSYDGAYKIYANSQKRRAKVVEDLEFVYNVPKIAVTENGIELTQMSEVSAGDRPIVKLTGVETTDTQTPKLIVAQYEGNNLKNVKMVDAVGSFKTLGDEFLTDFTVVSGADRIKLVYWDMDSLTPMVAYYEIK